MDEISRQQRRSFLFMVAGALPGIGLFGGISSIFGGKTFVTNYTIHLDHLDEKAFSAYNGDVTAIPFLKIVLPDLDSSWADRYLFVRKNFASNRSLIRSSRVLGKDSKSVSFVNVWKSREAFTSYCESADMKHLDSKFRAAGCQPSLSFPS
ncbi:MAG: hypothetical protein IPJ71_15980 [Bdellovibrionales bacterium]|nr:hypothetical protein [Bdellovibrionales bacterium]